MGIYLRHIILLLLSFMPASLLAQADEEEPEKPIVFTGLHQLRIGIDISRPIVNAFVNTFSGYEFQADYFYKKELYFAAEGGFGSASYSYPDLSYNSSSGFIRLGVDKGLLRRVSAKDWDMAFAGVRYGIAFINRSEGSYLIVDSLWGNVSGTIPPKRFTGHWAEITGGMRVELFRGLFAGWNIRGRFLINQQAFRELPPAYVAGYGKGDKNTIFDFNFYLSYALRWGRDNKNEDAAPAK